MMLTRALIAGCFLAVASLHCGAQVAYSEGETSPNDGSRLYKFSLTGKTAVPIGTAGTYANIPIAVVSLTFDSSNNLYAVGVAAGVPLLLNISTLTGAASKVIGPIAGISPQEAGQASLTFGCDGTLWLSSSQSNTLYRVDPATAVATAVGGLGAQITGIAAHGAVLYGAGGAVDGAGPNPNFYTINTTTGAASLVGSYGVSGYVSGVSPAFDASGQLWGLIGSFPTESGGLPTTWSLLSQISTTGTMSVLGSITSSATILKNATMHGMAIAPPVCSSTGGGAPSVSVSAPTLSPAAWLMLILGMIGLAGLASSDPAWLRRKF